MEYLLIILPIVIVSLSSWLLYKAMEEDDSVKWGLIALSLITVIMIYGWLIYAPSIGFISGFFEFMFAAGTSLLSGIMLLGALPGYRKLFSIFAIAISPVIMFVCLNLGMNYHPTTVARRNGDGIVEALEYYQIENGYYPEDLEDLLPEYVDEIRSPNTVWGWLYILEGNEYALGFVTWVDRDGYSLEIYRPSKQVWVSVRSTLLDNSQDPFMLGPTPTDW